MNMYIKGSIVSKCFLLFIWQLSLSQNNCVDESKCNGVVKKEPEECGSDQFRCENGQCIAMIDRCNRIYDCADGTDEYICGDYGDFEEQHERKEKETTTVKSVPLTTASTGYNHNEATTRASTIQPLIIQDQNPPVVRINPRYLQVKVGDSIEFRCIADSNPTATIVWTRGESGPLPDSATVENGVFRIPSVQKRDEAEYYCKATNPAGTSTVRTILYVTGSTPEPEVTIVVRRTAVTAIVGTTVTLECYSQKGSDVILVWSRDRQGLPSGTSQDNSVLTLPNVQPFYSGSYMCTGTTPSGKTGVGRTTLTIQPDVERTDCPDFWTPYGGSCYSFFQDRESWPQANYICEEHKGNLVTIETEAENNFIKTLIKDTQVHLSDVWIGANDRMREGAFTWVATDELITYSDWRAGEPNNSGNDENCVEIVDNDFTWNDNICSKRQQYVCEINTRGALLG